MRAMMKMIFAALAISLALCAAPAKAQGLLLNGQQQFTDSNGAPLAAGSVYFYIPNTTTPKTTYQNFDQTVPNTNPVVLNSAGRAVIWGTGLYRQVVYDQFGNLIWDQQTYASPVPGDATSGSFGARQSVASNTTTDIGVATTNNVLITGNSTIASFGSSASTDTPVFLVTFQNNLTLTYNFTSMILPGARSMSIRAGDSAIMLYLGSGNWRMVDFLPSANDPSSQGFGAEQTIAATGGNVDIGSLSGNTVLINGGGVTIEGFGTSALTAKPIFVVRFNGSNLLVDSATFVLPGNENITTANGDSLTAQYLGSGSWKVLNYTAQAEAAKHPMLRASAFTASGSFVIPSNVTTETALELTCVGPGAGGGSTSAGGGGGGGGGGSGGYGQYLLTGFTAGQTLTVTVGTGGAGSTNSGNNGAAGSGPTFFTYNAVNVLSCATGSGGTSGVSGDTDNPGGAGGAVTLNLAGSGLASAGTVVSYTGQTGGTGRYQGNNVGAGGAGGSNPLGQGGPPAVSINGGIGNGLDGNGYGAGGSGSASGAATQTTGGSGTNGFALVRGVY